jgi:hypothetical protein
MNRAIDHISHSAIESMPEPPGHLDKYPGYWKGPAAARQSDIGQIQRLHARIAALETELSEVRTKFAPFEKLTTPEYQKFIKDTEATYRSRLGKP